MSKLLQKKWEERQYQAHQQKMNAMKASVDNAPPKQYPHLVLRLKKVQKDEERQAEIDHTNSLLLQKMTYIMRTKGRVDNWNDYESKSLNRQVREREKEKIAEANVGIAKRIEAVRPTYDIHAWEEDAKKHEYYQDMWGNTTKDYQTPRNNHGARSRWGSERGETDTEYYATTSLPSIFDNRSYNFEDDYEDDFEDEDSRSKRSLPRLSDDSRAGSRAATEPGKGGGGGGGGGGTTKLPKIGKTPRDAGAENDAKLLFKATKGLIRSEDAVLKALIKKDHKGRMAVKQKFKELYDLDLETELNEAMGGDYQLLIEALLTDREDTDCDAIEKAIRSGDITTMVNLICSRNPAAMKTISKKYKDRNGASIEEDIEQKWKGDEDCQMLLRALLKQKQGGMKVDENKADQDALALHEDEEGRFTDPDGKFMEILNSNSLPQIKAMFESYKMVANGETVVESMKNDNCSKEFVKGVQAMSGAMNKGGSHYAENIRDNLQPNNKDLINTLLARSEVGDMAAVRKSYDKKYSSDLMDDVAKKCGKAGPLISQIVVKGGGGAKGGAKGGARKQSPDAGGKKKGPVGAAEKKPPTGKGAGAKKGAAGKDAGKDGKKGKGTVKEAKNFNADDDATKIHEAIKDWGTNEDKLIDILSTRSNAQRQQIKKKYKEKYGKELADELKSELSGDFEELILALTMTPVAYDAYCLHEAMDGLGTDEAALIGILCSRNAKAVASIRTEYKKAYGAELDDDVIGDTSGDFKDMLLELLKADRDQGTAVDKKLAEKEAKALAKDSGLDLDDPLFKEVMFKRSRVQVAATMEQFEKVSGQSFEDALKSASSGDAENAYLGLAGVIKAGPVVFYTWRLKEAMQGAGTNEAQVIRIIVSRSEIDLGEIKAKYKQLYKKTLEEDIESECSGDFKKLLLALIK